jgi:hypothetical protein
VKCFSEEIEEKRGCTKPKGEAILTVILVPPSEAKYLASDVMLPRVPCEASLKSLLTMTAPRPARLTASKTSVMAVYLFIFYISYTVMPLGSPVRLSG